MHSRDLNQFLYDFTGMSLLCIGNKEAFQVSLGSVEEQWQVKKRIVKKNIPEDKDI